MHSCRPINVNETNKFQTECKRTFQNRFSIFNMTESNNLLFFALKKALTKCAFRMGYFDSYCLGPLLHILSLAFQIKIFSCIIFTWCIITYDILLRLVFNLFIISLFLFLVWLYLLSWQLYYCAVYFESFSFFFCFIFLLHIGQQRD